MSDDLKWAIGLLCPPVTALIGWAFWMHYEVRSLRRHFNNLNDNQNREVKMLYELRDKWIEKFGRNGGSH